MKWLNAESVAKRLPVIYTFGVDCYVYLSILHDYRSFEYMSNKLMVETG